MQNVTEDSDYSLPLIETYKTVISWLHPNISHSYLVSQYNLHVSITARNHNGYTQSAVIKVLAETRT